MADGVKRGILAFHAARLKEAIVKFIQHDGPESAGNMAFLTMLSVFPFVIFLIAVSGLVGQTERGLEAITTILDVLPVEIAAVLEGPIQGILTNTSGQVVTFSIFVALWTAASGVEAARHALIRAFGKDFAHAFWRRRLESLLIVTIAAILILISFSIQVIGPSMMEIGSDLFPEQITNGIVELWVWLRYIISPVILGFGLYGVYLALTPRRVVKPSKLPGAIMSLLFLMLTAAGLSTFLKYAGNYDVTYGSLAGVVIMQLFCFVISIGFIIGAELNASYTRADKLKKQEAAKRKKAVSCAPIETI